MAAITALNVRLGMDASNFTEGANLARSEVNKVASVLRQSVPPAEKFQNDLALLDKTFSEAGKQSKQYANAVEFLKKKHGQLPPVVNDSTKAVDQLKQSMLSAVPGGSMLAGALKGPAGAALALTAAVAVVGREVSKAAQRIDEAAKSARSLGMAYSDMIALQMLAGETAGLDAGSVERGMGTFVKKLAEARVNGGALSETMKAVGLDVGQMAAMNPAEAFQQAADAISRIPDKAEQVRLSVALFGKEGVKMVEVLRQGGAALDKMNKETERLGLALSAEAVASVESMNDAFGRSGGAVQGIWNSITTSLAPTLTNVAKLAEDFFVFVRRAGEMYVKMHPGIQAIGFLVNKMLEGFRGIIALASDLMSLLGSVPDWLMGGELATGFEESNRLLDEMEAKANGMGGSVGGAAEQAEELAIQAERAAEAAAKIQASYESRIKDLQIESLALAGNVEEAERMRLAGEGYSKSQIDTLMSMQAQNAAIKERVELEKKAADEAKKASEKAWKDAEATAKKTQDELARIAKMKEDAFTKDVANAMAAAKKHFEIEKQKEKAMRDAVAKGPGAGMEADSADAAKFMADQANRSLAIQAVPEKPTPGEAELLEEARKQFAEIQKQTALQKHQEERLQGILTAVENNGFRRLR